MLKLSSDSKYYDFMYYNLSKIDCQRSRKESFDDVCIQVLDSILEKDVYLVRVDIALTFASQQAHFIYNVYFEAMSTNQKKLDICKDNMALELYEMVNQEIATLVSDGNGVMDLPKGNLHLVKIVK